MIRRFRSWLRKEVNNMAVIYVALIVKGKRTYDSVPDLIKPQVKEMTPTQSPGPGKNCWNSWTVWRRRRKNMD